MKSLGLEPTPNSGSGWIVKEDGQNENVICQLKSTDKSSIKINKLDLDKLEYNSIVTHKIPVFAIQFIESNEVYLLIKPENIAELSEYLNTGHVVAQHELLVNPNEVAENNKPAKVIKSSNKRKAYMSEHDNRFAKKSKSAT